jgi:hypothetical protein
MISSIYQDHKTHKIDLIRIGRMDGKADIDDDDDEDKR